MTAQVLRTIDKVDKIGVAGVVDLLQRPAEEFGAGLDSVRAALIGRFLETKGETDAETIGNLAAFFRDTAQVMSRVDLMIQLEETVFGDRSTAWDLFLSMPTNTDDTWSATARPNNIGVALDDLVARIGRPT